jgi:isopenicillin-N N-acyltransferase like protein
MFPVVTAPGASRAGGRAVGTVARERLILSIRNYAATFAWCGLDWREVKKMAQPFAAVIGGMKGPYIDEMRGLADGAGVSFDDILALNVRTELLPGTFGQPLLREAQKQRLLAIDRNHKLGIEYPTIRPSAPSDHAVDVGECTALAISKFVSVEGVTWLAQNWDWLGWQRPALIVLQMPTVTTLTEAGMLAKIGVNAQGLAVGLNIMKSNLDGRTSPGVPIHVTLRHLLARFDDIPSAQAWLQTQTFSSSSNIIAADAAGNVASFEISPRGCEVVMATDGIVSHTNHFLTSSCADIESNLGSSLSSEPRYACVNAHIGQWRMKREKPGLAQIKTVLTDRSQGAQSICRHPDLSLPPELRVESVAGIAINCNARVMHIAPNLPDTVPFSAISA